MRTYKDVLEDGIQLLETAAIEEARLDAWLLLEYTADITRAWYYAHMDDGLDAKTEERYRTLCTKRAQHIPLQHITGRAYFICPHFFPHFLLASSRILLSDILSSQKQPLLLQSKKPG